MESSGSDENQPMHIPEDHDVAGIPAATPAVESSRSDENQAMHIPVDNDAAGTAAQAVECGGSDDNQAMSIPEDQHESVIAAAQVVESSESDENQPMHIPEDHDEAGTAATQSVECSGSDENQPMQILEDHDVAAIAAAAEDLNIWNENTYECLSCAMGFDKNSEYDSHLTSEGHDLMKLVTGVVEPIPVEASSEFPPFYYCVLCNVSQFEYKPYEAHLKGSVHKEMAKFMRCTSFCTAKIVVGARYTRFPSCAQDFENIKSSTPANYCNLCGEQCVGHEGMESHREGETHKKLSISTKSCEFCNVVFTNDYTYESHLKTDIHKRMEDFVRRMVIGAEERVRSPPKKKLYSSAAGKPLPSLHLCKLCNIEFNDEDYFNSHSGISTHERIEKLIDRMSLPSISDVHNSAVYESVNRIHYCELCKIWCTTPTYETHMESSEHKDKLTHQKVRSWECSPEHKLSKDGVKCIDFSN